MKISIRIIKIFVAVLFIFSGLIKANDPLGLSYKMQEFFELWGLHFLNSYSLYLSIAMNVFEIVAGIALLLNWRSKKIIWLLLILIIFFTFLTGYAYLSGKVKSCGCFGDCLPLTAFQSFVKDVILLILIITILIYERKQPIKPTQQLETVLIIISFGLAIYLQIFVLKHLPIIDCLPFKKGNNIVEKMKIPEGALPDSFAITFQYKKDNKLVEFDAENFPNDFDDNYEFVKRFDKLVRKGNALPSIADFSLKTIQDTDTTLAILNQGNKYILFLVKDFSTNVNKWKSGFLQLEKKCNQLNIPIFIVTSMYKEAAGNFGNANITILKCDATVIKTAMRSNPGYMLMQQANILEKVSYSNVNDLIKQLN